MKKYFLAVLVMMVVSFASFGQTATKLDPVKADPKTTENAAKADGQLINKKNVIDPAALRNVTVKRRELKGKRRKNLQRRS